MYIGSTIGASAGAVTANPVIGVGGYLVGGLAVGVGASFVISYASKKFVEGVSRFM